MAITIQKFEHTVHLAYLELADVIHQFDRCRTIIEDIEQLQNVNTDNISPLHHPTSVTQFLRPDNAVIQPNITDLAQSAHAFTDQFYSVPLIMKGT